MVNVLKDSPGVLQERTLEGWVVAQRLECIPSMCETPVFISSMKKWGEIKGEAGSWKIRGGEGETETRQRDESNGNRMEVRGRRGKRRR